jgi:hypothetical protein
MKNRATHVQIPRVGERNGATRRLVADEYTPAGHAPAPKTFQLLTLDMLVTRSNSPANTVAVSSKRPALWLKLLLEFCKMSYRFGEC